MTKTYEDGENPTKVLHGLNFKIEEGEFVAIMGPSGSGKSTLLHILGFLDKSSGGEYLFDGKSMEDYSDEELARVRNKKMGFVFQAFNLLPRTSVLENVKLPLLYSGLEQKCWDKMAKSAIKIVGLEHRMEHEPAQLSGGEKQRVAIARALVNNPRVIFADEPTGNLDSKSGLEIMSIFQSLNRKGATILLVTHEREIALHASRILHFKDGELIKDELNTHPLQAAVTPALLNSAGAGEVGL